MLKTTYLLTRKETFVLSSIWLFYVLILSAHKTFLFSRAGRDFIHLFLSHCYYNSINKFYFQLSEPKGQLPQKKLSGLILSLKNSFLFSSPSQPCEINSAPGNIDERLAPSQSYSPRFTSALGILLPSFSISFNLIQNSSLVLPRFSPSKLLTPSNTQLISWLQLKV